MVLMNPHKLKDYELGIDEFKLGGVLVHPNHKTNFLIKVVMIISSFSLKSYLTTQ